MINPDLSKKIIPSESELKDIIVNFVGKIKNPETEDITVEDIVEVFAQQFPEFLLAVAEENWINGYTQALSDTKYVDLELRKNKDELEKLHSGK